LAGKLGFEKESLKLLFDMAKQKRLTLRVPESNEEKQKVLYYMKEAIKADNEVTKEEEELLNEVRVLYFENK